MPRKPLPENAILAELPAGGGGTVISGKTRIHHGLQIGINLVIERNGQYEIAAPGSDHPVAALFEAASNRSQRVRPMTRGEQRAWTRAAEFLAATRPEGTTVAAAKAIKAKRAKGEPSADKRRAVEQELMARYPDRGIVEGSLKLAGEDLDHPGRRTVVITCPNCSATSANRFRVVSTSDLFQCGRCVEHATAAKRQARREARAANGKPMKTAAK
jgi:hypothetical protein